jgi:hypothetical protein
MGLWGWKDTLSVVAAVAVGIVVFVTLPVSGPLLLVAAGAAAGATAYGLNEALNQEVFCLKCILMEAGKGALVGAFAALPVAFLPASAGLPMFLGANGLSGFMGYLGDFALTPGAKWNWGDAARAAAWGVGLGALGRGISGRFGTKTNGSGKRPTWRQSETDVGKKLGRGYSEQKSYKGGKEVPQGTKGSTRPDHYKTGKSVEVKNYKIDTQAERNKLSKTISDQAIKRQNEMPPGTKQEVHIDTRGQKPLSKAEEVALKKDISTRSGGIIKEKDIHIIRNPTSGNIPAVPVPESDE